jgi:hypothetical protein
MQFQKQTTGITQRVALGIAAPQGRRLRIAIRARGRDAVLITAFQAGTPRP